MEMTSRILVLLSTVLALTSYASAFWWGSSEQPNPSTQYFYHKRLVQNPGYQYTINDPRGGNIPSVPVQVPLQAQLGPFPNVHNVQLVPCLCPVSQDYAYGEQPQILENFVRQVPSQTQYQQANMVQVVGKKN
ncbi:hypothetical protein JTB14_021519 [Gonioctena quinquepunctata]|nr:hypothetical protein JTB14_021519 [Gonioctena quinquepunctata]